VRTLEILRMEEMECEHWKQWYLLPAYHYRGQYKRCHNDTNNAFHEENLEIEQDRITSEFHY
jgi:hypothetical protein